ncbi:potassium transporter Trk [Microbacterium sp. BWT-B31]|uniref:potassium transporter Trk n=1 Tax=Microbacterium sp. BWT-B31 TaxID=3232072 RepID=UPI0035280C2F
MTTGDAPDPGRDIPAAPDPDPAAPATHPHAELIEDEVERVRVRRAPKYAVFIVLGAALGLLVALVLTFSFNGTSDASPSTGLVYSPLSVFGFLSLIGVAVGVVVGGVTALIFDRVLARRAHDVAVDHERIHTVD